MRAMGMTRVCGNLTINIEEFIHLDGVKFNPTLSQDSEDGGTDDESGLLTVDKVRPKRPKKYLVLLHNDDYTTMEFVIYILENVFGKSLEEAQALMLKVHQEGLAACGIYCFEIAESKMNKVKNLAQKYSHPLKCTIEEE